MAGTRALLAAGLALAVTLAGCTDLVEPFTDRPSNDWALSMTQVDGLQTDGLTGRGVQIAVVDTGAQMGHKELDAVPWNWSDLVNGERRPYDDNGHGTHVSGLAVAQSNGGTGDPRVQGVAPGARLIAIKALPGSGTCQDCADEVARGIDRAVSFGAHVLVLSLGERPRLIDLDRQVETAVNDAIDRGVVVVAAAGNAPQGESGSECTVSSPANLPRVIAVGAVDRERNVASFSCKGDNSGGPLGLNRPQDPNRKPELTAPGVALVGPWPQRICTDQGPVDAEYCMVSGTSQATPIVGAIVALLLEKHPELKRKGPGAVEKIKRALTDTAEKPGFSGHHDRYGYGIVQGQDALAWLDQRS